MLWIAQEVVGPQKEWPNYIIQVQTLKLELSSELNLTKLTI